MARLVQRHRVLERGGGELGEVEVAVALQVLAGEVGREAVLEVARVGALVRDVDVATVDPFVDRLRRRDQAERRVPSRGCNNSLSSCTLSLAGQK